MSHVIIYPNLVFILHTYACKLISIFLNINKAPAVASGDQNSEDSEVVIISADSDPTTTQRPATTTPFVQRSLLKDFDNCGVKGSSNRVIGGAEVNKIFYRALKRI